MSAGGVTAIEASAPISHIMPISEEDSNLIERVKSGDHNAILRLQALMDKLEDAIGHLMSSYRYLEELEGEGLHKRAKEISDNYHRQAYIKYIGIAGSCLNIVAGGFDKDSSTARMIAGVASGFEGAKGIGEIYPQAQIEKLRSLSTRAESQLNSISQSESKLHEQMQRIQRQLEAAEQNLQDGLRKTLTAQ